MKRLAVLCLLYLAVVGSALAFQLFYWLVRNMDVTKTMLIALVTPLVAVALGMAVRGEQLTWQTVAGGACIMAGIGLITAFVYWQAVNSDEPLIPLEIFRDRDFGLCNVGVAVVPFAATAMVLPVTFYAQGVCGLSPTRSAITT